MTTLWSGLSIGAIWALVASSYNIILASTDTLNFAQGALVMFGTYIAYIVTVNGNLPIGLAVLVGAIIGAGIGALCELVAIWPLQWERRRSKIRRGGHSELMTTVGFATALVGFAELVWSANAIAVKAPGEYSTLTILGGRVGPWQLVLIPVAPVVAVGIHLWMSHTRSGLACAAMAEDREAAAVRGIDGRKVSLGSFIAAGSLAGLVGVIIAPTTFAYPSLSDSLALSGFVAVALGGLGSQIGGLIGGFVTGLVSAFGTRYLGASYGDLSVFGLLLLTLLFRPGGIAGQLVLRRV